MGRPPFAAIFDQGGPNGQDQLAIGNRLASRFPIQVDASHGVGGPFGFKLWLGGGLGQWESPQNITKTV